MEKYQQLFIEKVNLKIYPTTYSDNFAKTRFMEKISIDPIENVFKKFETTRRENACIFHKGFIKYPH